LPKPLRFNREPMPVRLVVVLLMMQVLPSHLLGQKANDGSDSTSKSRSEGAPSARGQVELGIDASVVRNTATGTTVVDIPVGLLRIGVFVSASVSIEPTVAVRYERLDGASLRSIAMEASVLYHFGANLAKPRVFFRPSAGIRSSRSVASASDEFSSFTESLTDFVVGAGVGIKVPVNNRLSIRSELFARQGLGGESQSSVGLFAGLSYFLR
jgi:hypothetical protein